MKLDENYILKTIAGTPVVMPVGEAVTEIHGMIKLTPSAAHIWKALEEGKTPQEILEMLRERYTDVSEARLESDMNAFLDKLRSYRILKD